jgi:hypothetical protein
MLSIAAVISLALGFFQDFGPGRESGKPPVDWIEGVAIIVAIFAVVCIFESSSTACALTTVHKGDGWFAQ